MMPAFLTGLSVKAKPPQKVSTLNIIIALAEKHPKSIGHVLVTLAMPVAELTCDIKKDVKETATNCMSAICACTGNKDQEPFLPYVVKAAQSIDSTHACVEKLAGCIFVQNVETPALAAMLPVLSRGLNDKAEKALVTLRKAGAGAEVKDVTPEAALATLKEALGDKFGGDAAFDVVASHVAGLAATATNMRSFDS